jgi:hypothetical protein
MLLLLPWMHGYDHDEACQSANSGLYQVGSSLFGAQLLPGGAVLLGVWVQSRGRSAGPLGGQESVCCPCLLSLQDGTGRRIGESTESLWSLLKPLTKMARYMTLAHWHDSYNQALGLITTLKQRTFTALMKTKVLNLKKKLGWLPRPVQSNRCYLGHF